MRWDGLAGTSWRWMGFDELILIFFPQSFSFALNRGLRSPNRPNWGTNSDIYTGLRSNPGSLRFVRHGNFRSNWNQHQWGGSGVAVELIRFTESATHLSQRPKLRQAVIWRVISVYRSSSVIHTNMKWWLLSAQIFFAINGFLKWKMAIAKMSTVRKNVSF